MASTPEEFARCMAQTCLDAAVPVMEVYASDFTAEQKSDRSPVTEVDRRAEAIILKRVCTRISARDSSLWTQ